ncbi:MAG: hypothetical protein M3O70_26505 [Actinomycetota bacterium]|nr:hypothetical protein [Actinomycetota bacterium]
MSGAPQERRERRRLRLPKTATEEATGGLDQVGDGERTLAARVDDPVCRTSGARR